MPLAYKVACFKSSSLRSVVITLNSLSNTANLHPLGIMSSVIFSADWSIGFARLAKSSL